MQLKSILCPIDFSDFSAAAYQHALSLAEYYKARIVALHVVELWKYPFADYAACEADYAKFSRAMNEGGEVQLRRFVKQYSTDRIQPELVTHQGNAPNLILSIAQKENIELIVLGTHGRRGFDRLVLGSSTDRVMRKASCPVLVVPNISHKDYSTGPDGRHRLSRILYTTDFSNNSERARGYAISLTAQYRAELTLLHVAEGAPDLARADSIIAEHTQELDKLLSDAERKDLNVRSVVRFGKAYQEIGRHAIETQASLIIMTARGGDAVDRAIFGSTTYRVIQLGPCPVLAVHT
jgi:nucleotide-binding universal stress UspA family protein